MQVRVVVTACVISFSVSACTEWTNRWQDRYGPNPVPQTDAIAAASDRQIAVLKALGDKVPIAWPPATANDWRNVTLMGFNVVDDACTEYLLDMYKLDRDKNRLKDTLTLAGSTTAAVLNATQASTEAMAIVTQGFGATSSLSGILADSYLFKISPTTIQGIEQKLQTAYRTDASKATIGNGAAAYQYIKGYLNLCSAPTIEASIEDYLAKSTGTAQQPNNGNVAGANNSNATPQTPAGATPSVSLK
jgi:hypothetical protein